MLITGGYDRVDLALSVIYADELVGSLQGAKDAALEAGCSRAFGGDGWMITESGKRKKGEHAPYYAFLAWDSKSGLEILIGSSGAPRQGFCNVLVHAGAVSLTQYGWGKCEERMRGFFAANSMTVAAEALSQVDVAIDVTDLDVRDWQDAVSREDYVTRAHHLRLNANVQEHRVRRKRTGFTVGKGTLIRCYDKIEEVETQSPHKMGMMIQHRWGGEVPDVATRLEMQIRRNWLREFGASTMAEFEADRGQLIAVMLGRFFRLIVPRGTHDQRRERRKTLPEWAAVADWAIKQFVPVVACAPASPSGFVDELAEFRILQGVADRWCQRVGFAGENASDRVLEFMQAHVTRFSDPNAEPLQERFEQRSIERLRKYPLGV